MADILVFAPHPDDAEIGAGGTIARHSRLGYEIVVCDLTAGELATNGDPKVRAVEAHQAARILGLGAREGLGLQDRALDPTPGRIRAVTEAIRRWRPRVVLAPCPEDRHPDHGAANRLVQEALFNAGLSRYPAAGAPHRVSRVAAYFVNARVQPDFLVDVSEVYEVKRAALGCYASQFGTRALDGAASGEPARGPVRPHPTPLNRGYLEAVELRDAWFGSLTGVAHAEGFLWDGPVRLDDLVRQL